MVKALLQLNSKTFFRSLFKHHHHHYINSHPLAVFLVSNDNQCRTLSTSKLSDAQVKEFEQKQDQIKQELQQEASFLTKSLYRTCLRSVRLIRPGNEHDEAEFQRREEERLEEELSPSKNEDIRMGMFSMLPPVDRQDELRSRAEYYHQYARENFVQESDCLPINDDLVDLKEGHVSRYLFFLKKGEKDRQWLLKDMQFHDPYQEQFPQKRADEFQKKAIAYIQEKEQVQRHQAGAPIYDEFLDVEEDDDDDEEDGSDSDSDDEEYPAWFKEKYPEKVRT